MLHLAYQKKSQCQIPGGVPSDQLLDVNAVAALLGVSPTTVRRLRDTGHLPDAVKLGSAVRWRLSDIQTYIASL